MVESFLFDAEYFNYMAQLVTRSLSSSYNLGQYTVAFALCRHFWMPRWPLCICLRICGLSLSGMMIRFPFRSNPSATVIASRNVQQGWSSGGKSLIFSGQPCVTISLRSTSVSSCFVLSCNTWSLSALQLAAGDIMNMNNWQFNSVCYCSSGQTVCKYITFPLNIFHIKVIW